MKIFKQYSHYAFLSMLFLFTVFVVGCGGGGGSSSTAIAPLPPVPPTIISTTPMSDDVNVILNKSVVALFNKALDPTTVTLTTFTLVDDNTTAAVSGSVTYNSNTMIFNPTSDLNASTHYTATITTGVKDLAGTALASMHSWSFTTGTTTDIVQPLIVSTYPIDTDLNASINISVSALFNEALDPTTVDTTTFTLETTIGNIPVAGTVSYDSNTMIFNPTADLNASTEYTATISTSVTDLAGNALAVPMVWSFTTGTTTTIALTSVDLGTAGTFAILTKTGISATVGTTITGDIGVSPAALSYITGFGTLSPLLVYETSPLVTGKIYAANMAVPTPAKMTTAVSDMETAYTNAAGRTTPDYTELGAGDVSGMTLSPGLYKWGTGLVINTDITLSGSATDIWIFQIAGNLTLASNVTINLAGGALAKNIFWQTLGVSLGTSSDFKGVALSQGAIVVNTGATVNGRLLTQTAVTLDANTIAQP